MYLGGIGGMGEGGGNGKVASSKVISFLLTDLTPKYLKLVLSVLTLLHSKRPKLHRVLAVLSAKGLKLFK